MSSTFFLNIFSIFMGFFAIMNPIANTPIFLGLTSSFDASTQKKIAKKSLLIAFIIILIFSLAGKLIFELFGITLPAFRITGGILVFFIGLNMLNGKQSSVHHSENERDTPSSDDTLDIAISPLAMPLLAGPGTIATAMNFSADENVQSLVATIGVFALLCFITYLFFISGEKFIQYIGKNALGVITRMMGLILAVIGINMLIAGLQGTFGILSISPKDIQNILSTLQTTP